MDGLVERLSAGDHPATVGGPQSSLEDFRKRVEETGYVLITFTDTQGGTQLGVQVDRAATDTSEADFDAASGTVHVEGALTLNYVRVRCVADIDLLTLNGTGHLEVIEEVNP